VLVSGHALAPGGTAQSSWQASVRVGPVKKILRLHGPRKFLKHFFGWRLGQSEPVFRVPLDYRLAYGGCVDVPASLTSDGYSDSIKFPGNPAGCGWLPTKAAYGHLPRLARKHVQQWINTQTVLPAPQFESASEPLRHPYQDLPAQGFGAIARWWEPRLSRQGSYGGEWRTTRYPLLPENFDPLYFQSAPADLVCRPHLIGDERVSLTGLLAEHREITNYRSMGEGAVRRSDHPRRHRSRHAWARMAER
jgi:hypothetical protein